MKTALLLLGLAVVALSPAQAQVFRPHSFGYRGDWHGPSRGWGYGGGPRWSVSLGFGPSYYWANRGYGVPIYVADSGYYDYGYDYTPAYTYALPSYTASGTWLGAIAGAIIGNNSGSLGHNAWRGAAYGAGLGYIFGAVADSNAARARAVAAVRASNAPVVTVAPAPASAAPAAAPAANAQQPVTIINNYYNGATPPMSQANGLFGR